MNCLSLRSLAALRCTAPLGLLVGLLALGGCGGSSDDITAPRLGSASASAVSADASATVPVSTGCAAATPLASGLDKRASPAFAVAEPTRVGTSGGAVLCP